MKLSTKSFVDLGGQAPLASPWRRPCPPSFKISCYATVIAVYQHYSSEGSKFRSKVAERLPGLLLNHSFTLLFAFCKLSLKKRLLKFDQELSASWKKKFRFTLSATNVLVVFYSQNFSESVRKRKRWQHKR